MKLDRVLQKEILTKLNCCYPERDRASLFKGLESDSDQEKKLIANMFYLEEHGLIISGLSQNMDGSYGVSGSKITKDGIDFLAEDGGLTAILGTVTIRIHEETLQALIGDRINQSDLPEPDKQKLSDALRSLSVDAIKQLTMKLLDKGLENLPTALPVIQTYLMSFLH